MPRAEVGTPKWLANKMKSKGLQRLRWYCQMCEKQCRDENGFKCHMNSESHLRMMQVFSQCSGKFIDDFSRAFEADFMRLMKTRYCRARVLANTVYCEMISNKEHVHMNATAWVTLNGFLRHLEESGQLKVEWNTPGDPNQRGPYITYIDRERDAKERAAADRLKKYVSPEELEDRKFQSLMKMTQQQLPVISEEGPPSALSAAGEGVQEASPASPPSDEAVESKERTTVSPSAIKVSIANVSVNKPSGGVSLKSSNNSLVKPTQVSALFKRSKKKHAKT